MTQKTKYTDYTPNRTTRTIRQEMDMIQAVAKYSEKNKRRRNRNLSDVACRFVSALLYAGCAGSLIYLGYQIVKK